MIFEGWVDKSIEVCRVYGNIDFINVKIYREK